MLAEAPRVIGELDARRRQRQRCRVRGVHADGCSEPRRPRGPHRTPFTLARLLPMLKGVPSASRHRCGCGRSCVTPCRPAPSRSSWPLDGVLRAVPAQADIYAWRDEQGRLVLSKHPAPTGVQRADVCRPRQRPASGRRGPQASPWTARAAASAIVVAEHARRHALSPDLVRAVIRVESGWNPRAVSPKGALGLMQLMPATAARVRRGRSVRSRAEHPRRRRVPASR